MRLEPSDMLLIAAVALAVFLGHLYPIFLKFKGGKGVATALGVLLAFSVWLGLTVLAIWLAVALVSRYSSLAALVAAAVAPVCAWLFDLPREWVAVTCVISVLLLWRHRNNIKNLMAGTEGRIGGKKTGASSKGE
jgi:glycerol-3-phosphate acyltransferase PlsY